MSTTRLRIRSMDVRATTIPNMRYDLLVGTLGYEARSMYVPRLMAAQCRQVLTPAFDLPPVLNFNDNAAIAQLLHFMTPSVDSEGFEQAVRAAANELSSVTRPQWAPQVLVDVSSMTRDRIARAVSALVDALPAGSIIDVVYAPAEYVDDLGDDGPVTESGPLPHFAGWSGSPDVELGMIIGLGFESHLALGVVEQHEPADVWCFLPTGIDGRYDDEVLRRNALLLERVPPTRLISYDVTRPFQTADSIEGILQATGQSHRMMVVPLGAKAFCVSTLAVALAYNNRLAVWRVSVGNSRRIPIDRVPTGDICALRLHLDEVEGPGPSATLPMLAHV